MESKILKIMLSVFFFIFGICLILGIIWIKPVLDSQRLLNENSLIMQKEIINTIKPILDSQKLLNESSLKIEKEVLNTIELVTDVAFTVAVCILERDDLLSTTDANKMMDESIKNIEEKSKRFGKLGEILNEARMNRLLY